jgi:GntR family transcriptional regulator, phosphonate transport system regulatory protein
MKTRTVSLWRRISDALAQEIQQGALAGGDRLPTDIELAERFGCNKHTARRAIAHLEQEGLVRVEWGRGTFVVDANSVQHRGTEAHLIHKLLDQHRNLRRKVVRIETLPAADAVAKGLAVASGSPCVLIVLLSESDDVPLSLGFNYFPLKRLPLLAQAIQRVPFASVADALRAAGVEAHQRSRVRIGARLPSVEEAMLLKMARQQPLLETESIEVDDGGHAVTYTKTCFRADRLQFVVPSP